MFRAFIDERTADLRSSVLINATRLLESAIVLPPCKPINKAVPAAPEYFKNSLLLMPAGSSFLLPFENLAFSLFIAVLLFRIVRQHFFHKGNVKIPGCPIALHRGYLIEKQGFKMAGEQLSNFRAPDMQ
jgi:hypothetical protein